MPRPETGGGRMVMAYIKVLGAYGGKHAHKHTTSFRVSDEIIIDAGNIIDGLSNEAVKVRHIFLTHAHFDHIIDIPFLVDSLFSELETSITIHALPHTIDSIRKHLMNDDLWPDFSRIPIPATGEPAVVYHELAYDQTCTVGDFSLTPIRAEHIVPTCGYIVEHCGARMLLSGDTYVNPEVARRINEDPHISVLLLELSFPSRLEKIARDSMHLTPVLAVEMLRQITRRDIKVYFYHMKPAYCGEIERELRELMGRGASYWLLDDNEVIEYCPL